MALVALLFAANNALQADVASRHSQRPLPFLAFGLYALLLAFLTPIYLRTVLSPGWYGPTYPHWAALFLGLGFYWVSRQIEAMRDIRRWSKDREQRRGLKQQGAK